MERATTRAFVGCGAGFAGDRLDAGIAVARHLAACDGPRTLIYECLAERTLALAHGAPHGWSPYLERYLEHTLAPCLDHGIRIVTNMGAADPMGGARAVHALAGRMGLRRPRIAVVTGDDLQDPGGAAMDEAALRAAEPFPGDPLPDGAVIAANAYLGAAPVRDACLTGADVVLVGRTTDSALVLGPLMADLGWSPNDLDRMAAGTICGHLLECGAQVSGAYFADPGFKDVPDLAHVGFPVAEVETDGTVVVTKPAGTGGRVDAATVTEQLLYEMHDPAAYLVPDVTADVTGLRLDETGPDRVRVTGARGHAPPAMLKAVVCCEGGWLGETELSYAGPNARARAGLAADIVRTRMAAAGHDGVAFHLIGEGAAFRTPVGPVVPDPTPQDLRLRASLLTREREGAELLGQEMLSLYCSGPAGGGGHMARVTPQIATGGILVPREMVEPFVTVEVVA